MIKNKFYKIGKLNKRICLLSDIHYSYNYDFNLFNKIIENIKSNKPNFICMPGDIVDSTPILLTEKKEYLTDFIKKLSLICPVIIVKGNHDEIEFLNKKETYLSVDNYFMQLNTLENVYYLDNKTLVRDNITFTGLSLSYEYYHKKKKENNNTFIKELDNLNRIDITKYNILLCHSPINTLTNLTIEKSKNIKKFDLILSGHMHNGLVFDIFDRKNSIGWISPHKTLFPKFAKGKTTKTVNNKEIKLIVTGGVIKFSEHAPKILNKINFIYPNSIDYIDI